MIRHAPAMLPQRAGRVHLSPRERSKSSFMISGEGFSPLPTSCPHPNFERRNSTSPDGRGNAHAPRLSHLSHRERSASNARRVRACLPTIRPLPESRTLSCRLHDGIRSYSSDQTPSCDGVTRRAGFSLIELAIVLVILGLLVGGIMTGQSLIRAAELRSVTTEYNRYVAATQTFRDKYFALPGDMPNATAFWGAATTCPGNETQPSTNATTCNGDGDGRIEDSISNPNSSEEFRFWQQLANAGLIEGTYTGVRATSANAWATQVGLNTPLSKLPNSGWFVNFWGIAGGDASAFAADYGNAFHFGGQSNGTFPHTANLKPEELWNIDSKMDDGRPATGKVIAYGRSVCANSTSATDIAANYNLSSSSLRCTIMFARAF
jgi:prepilin-type N-terminal cleavage/methylation domain-containing protein